MASRLDDSLQRPRQPLPRCRPALRGVSSPRGYHHQVGFRAWLARLPGVSRLFVGPGGQLETSYLLGSAAMVGVLALSTKVMLTSTVPVETAAPVGSVSQAGIAEAEAVLRQFYASERWEDMVPLVRSPEVVAPVMRRWYADHPHTGVSSIDIVEHQDGLSTADGEAWTAMFKVILPGEPSGRIVSVELDEAGYKVDWETAVGYEALSLPAFQRDRPESEVFFRLNVAEGTYYNYSFSDDLRWKSFGFVSPDGLYSVYGFAERGSPVEKILSTYLIGSEFAPVIVSLQWPEGDKGDVAAIRSVRQFGWVSHYAEGEQHFDLIPR